MKRGQRGEHWLRKQRVANIDGVFVLCKSLRLICSACNMSKYIIIHQYDRPITGAECLRPESALNGRGLGIHANHVAANDRGHVFQLIQDRESSFGVGALDTGDDAVNLRLAFAHVCPRAGKRAEHHTLRRIFRVGNCFLRVQEIRKSLGGTTESYAEEISCSDIQAALLDRLVVVDGNAKSCS